jgi:O-antigen/teichoic acid export membrane protein
LILPGKSRICFPAATHPQRGSKVIMFSAAHEIWRRFLGGKEGANEFSIVLQNLLGDSAQYFAGLVLMGVASTILLPLYMRYLSPAQFGLYALTEVTCLALIIVAGLGFNTSYLKWFAEENSRDSSRLLGSMLITSGLVAIGMGGVLTAAMRSDAGVRLLGGPTKEFAYLLMPLVFLESIYASFETHLRARRRPTSISVAAVIRLVAIALASIWLIAFQHRGLVGLFEGRVLGDLTGLLTNLLYCWRDLSVRFSRHLSTSMLRYGMPLVVTALMMLGLDAAGRYLLNTYGSLDQVGLYTAGIKISNLMRVLFVAPLGAAWGGLIFQIAKKPNAQFIFSKLFGYIFLVSAAISLTLAFLTPTLFAVFSAASYRPAMPLVPWLLLVQVVSITQCPVSTGMYVGNATRWLIPIYGAGLALDVVLCRVLIPRYGMYGAAWAWLIGWIVICMLMMVVGQRHYPLRFEWEPIAISVSLCSVVPMIRHMGLLNLDRKSLVIQAVCSIAAVAIVAMYVVRDVRKSHTAFHQSFRMKDTLTELAAEAD